MTRNLAEILPVDDGYEPRAHALMRNYEMPVCAFEVVSDAAIELAKKGLESMMRLASVDVIDRLRWAEASVGIIGRNQVATDIPPHSFLKDRPMSGNRTWNAGTRGLGGTVEVPTTTVGEENLLMDNDPHYPNESILVHEFANAVMNIGFSVEQQTCIAALYDDALTRGFSKQIYMFSNAQEFWGNGTQAFFSAIARTDVNEGIWSRAILKERLPSLFALMMEVYGDNDWSYFNDAPRKWNLPAIQPSIPTNGQAAIPHIVQSIIKLIQQHLDVGSGMICQSKLFVVFQKVDKSATFKMEHYTLLLQAAGLPTYQCECGRQDAIRYQDFITWMFDAHKNGC